MALLLELLQAIRQRLAREVRSGPRDLYQCKLERQARVASLPHVLNGDGEKVDEPDYGRFAELVRLRSEALTGLFGHRQRLRHFAHVLHEHDMTKVFEQVDDEPAEVLALLGELFEEGEGAGRVAVDHKVAETEQRLLLDCAGQLQ